MMDKNTVININVVTKEKEMTLKEKIDSFCAGKIALHVPTKDLFVKVCGELKQRGIKWFNDKNADEYLGVWGRFKEETVLCLDDDGMEYIERKWCISNMEDSPIVKVNDDDFKPKGSTIQQVAKVVLESAKKRADKKDPLDAMCGVS